jgi:hypothetical protein
MGTTIDVVVANADSLTVANTGSVLSAADTHRILSQRRSSGSSIVGIFRR